MMISPPETRMSSEYIAFFDLDGTIIKANSGKLLVRHAYNKGMMTRSDLLRAINLSFLYRYKLRDTLKIINDMVSWVAGLPEVTILEMAADISEKILIPSIHSEVAAELEYHRTNKAKLVILSSALGPVCKLVGDFLGFDDILSSDLEIINGHYTGRPIGNLCFAQEKAVRLATYCEKNNTNPGNSWYYGDSIPDQFALSIVGYPVCINPDKSLKKIALRKKWKIYLWH